MNGHTYEELACFYSIDEAVQFCDANPKINMFIIKEMDGRFHVYDMDGGE